MTVDESPLGMPPGVGSDYRAIGPTAANVGLAVCVVLLVAAAVGKLVGAGSGLGKAYTFNVVAAFAFGVLGGLLVRRQPDNWVSRLFVGIALASALVVFSAGFSSYRSMAWLNQWSPAVAYGLFPLLLLVFPDGRLPSATWRPVAGFAVAGLVVGAGGLAVAAWDVPGLLVDLDAPRTGLAIGALRIARVGLLVVVASLVAAVTSLVVRFRRSSGDTRQQLKWLAVGGGLVAIAVLVDMAGVPYVAEVVAATAIPVGSGIAILKYRLYDIDVVISKTVVFAGLVTFITAMYVGMVVGVGTLVGAGGQSNLWLSITATAAIAVAFEPVRERLHQLANRLVYGVRATPYEVLSRFSSHLGETSDPDAVLDWMARLLADGTGGSAAVWLQVGGRMRPAAVWPDDAVVDQATDLKVDVTHEGELLGALSVSKQRGDAPTLTDHKLVSDLAAQAALVLRNVRLTAELRQRLVDLRDSRRRLVEAQDAERRRLERDLHDGAQQQLVALKMKLALAKTLADREQAEKTAQLLDGLSGEADEAVQTLRELAHGIYPPLLASEGLGVALHAHARKAGVPVVVDADGVGRYPAEIEAAVYFCVLEAIQNAAKYAQASHVSVRLTQQDGQLVFEVTDDGIGFDPDTTPRGHGLTNIADRLDALAGVLVVTSSAGAGTALTGRVPVSTKVLT